MLRQLAETQPQLVSERALPPDNTHVGKRPHEGLCRGLPQWNWSL
jgi:hypothetical protein